MKNYILILLLLVSVAANAQWASSGSNLTNTTQNIGIGLTTPATRFDMTMTNPTNQAAGTMTFGAYHSSTYPLFQVNRARYVSSAASAVSANDIVFSLLGRGFINSGYRDVANIRFNIGASPSGTSYPGYITFHTTNTNSTVLSERLRITEAGDIGIGTSSPTTSFEISRVTAATLKVSATSAPSPATVETSASGVRGILESVVSGTKVRIGSRSSSPVGLVANDTEYMTLLTDGRVGIGTTSPGASYKLDVNGAINATGFNVGGVPLIGSNWTISSGNAYRSTGNVGIGSTAPATKLQVDIASTNTTYGSPSNSDVSLTLKNTSATNNNFNMITYADANGVGIAQLGAVTTNHSTHIGKFYISVKSNAGMLQRLIFDEGWTQSTSMFMANDFFINSPDPIIHTAEGTSFIKIYDHEDVANGLKAGGVLVSDTYDYANPGKNDLVVKGSIGIGTPFTSNPNAYKLAVNGKIGAKDLQIETTSTTWPDYVFEKSYELPALSDVEKYVQENKHLEGMPSAAEVKEKGYSVNELNEALLKKVEELTLYVIEQQKQINELKKEVSSKKRKK